MEVLIAIRHTTSRSKMSTSTSISQALSRHADALSPEHISGRITIDHIHIHKKSIECTRLLWPPLDRASILDILPLFPSSAWPFLCCHQTSPSPKCANCKHWSTYRSGDELLIIGAGTDAKDCSTAGCNTAGLGHGHTGTCEGRLQRGGGHHRGGLLCTVRRVLPSKCAAEILVQMRPMSGADLTRAASLNRQPSFWDAGPLLRHRVQETHAGSKLECQVRLAWNVQPARPIAWVLWAALGMQGPTAALLQASRAGSALL